MYKVHAVLTQPNAHVKQLHGALNAQKNWKKSSLLVFRCLVRVELFEIEEEIAKP
jgi:hypothetical protein